MIVAKTVSFEAAHLIPNYEGKCRELHGHHWEVEVAIEGSVDPVTKMVVDFALVKKILEGEILDRFDHTLLNDFFGIPTAEVLAQYIFIMVENRLKLDGKEDLKLKWVKVWETKSSYAMEGTC